MYFEKGDIIVTGSKTQRIFAIGTPDEHFEIRGEEVTICWSNSIDLNSKPDITRVLNYIENKYDVDLFNIIL